jgi:hypothetical protein
MALAVLDDEADGGVAYSSEFVREILVRMSELVGQIEVERDDQLHAPDGDEEQLVMTEEYLRATIELMELLRRTMGMRQYMRQRSPTSGSATAKVSGLQVQPVYKVF